MSLEKVTETFDQWAENGRDVGMEEGHGDVVRQVIAQMDIAPGEKILDLGCGNGWATRLLAQAEAGAQAVGIDASPKMIARADELHSFTIRARYELGTFEDLEYEEGSFDRVFSMEALYYVGDLERALGEILRVLKPGGKADIVVDHFKENTKSADWGEVMGLELHFLGEAEWKGTFEAAGFTNVSTRRVMDSRGPGEEASFEGDECVPTFEDQIAMQEAGSLWIHAEKG